MDSISLILTSLTTGAASLKEPTNQALKDSYSRLTSLLQQKFAGNLAALLALTRYEMHPEAWRSALAFELAQSGADKREEIIREAQSLLTLTDAQQSPLPLSPAPPSSQKWRNPLSVALLALALLLIIGSSIWALQLLPRSTSSPGAPQIVGNAYFDSSNQFIESSTNGINDELHLALANIPPPAPGKSYYLWLLSDKNKHPTTYIALGAVPINHNLARATYITPQHTNLIATTSRLVITEQPTSLNPSFPADKSSWRYYAEIPQTYVAPISSGVLNASTLTFLRLLLFEGTKLAAQGLHGGAAIQFLHNTQKVLEWSNSARDEWDLQNTPLMHRHFIRILQYLDGLTYVRADLPSGTPVLVNATLAQNGLITVIPGDNPEAYVPRIATQVLGVANSPDLSVEKHALAVETERDIRINVENWLQQVRQDARQLFTLSDAQLAQRSTLPLLNDMLEQARNAYTGQINPVTDQRQGGVLNDYDNIQRIASFDFTQYVSP
jgi:hypothetical protein